MPWGRYKMRILILILFLSGCVITPILDSKATQKYTYECVNCDESSFDSVCHDRDESIGYNASWGSGKVNCRVTRCGTIYTCVIVKS